MKNCLKILTRYFYPFFVAIFILFFNVQCLQQQSHFASLSGNAQISDRFYIKFDSGHYESNGETAPLYELSSTEDLMNLADCGVDKGEDSVEDIYCILNLNEADIGASQGGVDGIQGGIPLELNVPTEMCEYTQWMIPWHWNQRSGVGPPRVYECTVTNEGATDGEGETQTNKYRSLNKVDWYLDDEDSISLCSPQANQPGYPYDQSEKEGLENCCFGKAAQYTRECSGSGYSCCDEAPSINNPDFKEDSEHEWGGDMKSCLGGPVRASNWEAYVKIGGDIDIEIPTAVVSSTWQRGTRRNFSIGPAFDSVLIGESVPVANYFDGIEDLPFYEGSRLYSHDCEDCPAMFFADFDKKDQAQALPIGYPYFTLSCLDSDFEVLHRVHLIIREWNTLEEFLVFQETGGRSGDPDVEGTEGDECLYYEPDEYLTHGRSGCNDFLDIDDIEDTTYRYPNILEYGG